MPDFAEHAERTALRGVAHLLPERWRQIIDLIAAPVPPTPTATIRRPAIPPPGDWRRSTTSSS